VAPVLAAANEKGLDRDLPRLFRHGEDVGIGQAFGVDRLAALDESGGAQPVAQHGGALEIQRLGSLAICASISRCTALLLPPRKSFAWRTSSP
jgi:hypothetical protein